MFCPKCGANLAENAQFCGSCGFQIATVSGSANATGDAFQHYAGAATGLDSAASPYSRARYERRAGETSASRAIAAPKRVSKRTVAIALAVLVAAAVVVAGMFTGWFGLARDNDAYVLTKATYYDDDGEKAIVAKYKCDAHGNAKAVTTTWYSRSVSRSRNDDGTYTERTSTNKHVQETTLEKDKHGYTESESTVLKNSDGEASDDYRASTTYDNDIDSDGRLVACDYESKSEFPNYSNELKVQTNEGTRSYEYYPSGRLKQASHEATYTNGDGSTSYGYSGESEYDERGYLVHRDSYRGQYEGHESYSLSIDYAWQFDLTGKPTGYTMTFDYDGEDDTDTYDDPWWYRVETDEAGNIVAIYDAYGTKMVEYEYERVDDPSDDIKHMETKRCFAYGL